MSWVISYYRNGKITITIMIKNYHNNDKNDTSIAMSNIILRTQWISLVIRLTDRENEQEHAQTSKHRYVNKLARSFTHRILRLSIRFCIKKNLHNGNLTQWNRVDKCSQTVLLKMLQLNEIYHKILPLSALCAVSCHIILLHDMRISIWIISFVISYIILYHTSNRAIVEDFF